MEFRNVKQHTKEEIMLMTREQKFRVVEHHTTPANTLDILANDNDERIRALVAKNPNTSSEILEKLGKDYQWEVLYSVAHNPKSPAKTLEKLANDFCKLEKEDSWTILSEVASNPNTPAKTLAKLANEEYFAVRMSVAANLNTPAKTLDKLANDKELLVRKEVANNDSTPSETFNKMCDNIIKNASELGICEKVGATLAYNPLVPEEVLYKLAEAGKNQPNIMDPLLCNGHLPKELLHKLADHPSVKVKEDVAQHPGISQETLDKLIELQGDSYANTRKFAMENINYEKNMKETTVSNLTQYDRDFAKIQVAHTYFPNGRQSVFGVVVDKDGNLPIDEYRVSANAVCDKLVSQLKKDFSELIISKSEEAILISFDGVSNDGKVGLDMDYFENVSNNIDVYVNTWSAEDLGLEGGRKLQVLDYHENKIELDSHLEFQLQGAKDPDEWREKLLCAYIDKNDVGNDLDRIKEFEAQKYNLLKMYDSGLMLFENVKVIPEQEKKSRNISLDGIALNSEQQKRLFSRESVKVGSVIYKNKNCELFVRIVDEGVAKMYVPTKKTKQIKRQKNRKNIKL